MKLGVMMAAALALMVAGGAGAPAVAAKPAAASVDLKRIDRARLDAALQDMVKSGRVTGASAVVWHRGKEAYYGQAGLADREANRPMTRDTLVAIYSMTKPVTGVALLQLWEQGRFRLDDPLANYLPEFAAMRVQDGTDAKGQPLWRAASRPITVRDILRHTAGFGYGWGESAAHRAFAEAQPLALDHDLAEFGRRLARVPLVSDPGTQWNYSAAVDVQALLIERLTGMVFADYVHTHVLKPLGMTETAWHQPMDRLPRFAAIYERAENGTLARMPDSERLAMNFPGSKLTMGGAGLVAPIDDYLRFARMLLNGGTLDGVRILKPSTVQLMATDQLDPAIAKREWLPGKVDGGFGFNVAVRTAAPADADAARGAVGEYFWDGRATTLFFVDPHNDLTAVLYVQVVPFDGSLHRDFRRAVYGADYVGPPGDR